MKSPSAIAVLMLAFTVSATAQNAPAKAASPSSAPAKGAAAQTSKAPATTKAPAKAAPASGSTAVITISGLCQDTTGGKVFAPDCTTTISEAQFDKLVKAVGADMPKQVQKNLAQSMGEWMAYAAEARKEGLDKAPGFEELLRFARLQVMAQQMIRNYQKQAEKVSDAELRKYFDEHKNEYEDFSMVRIVIPRETKPADEKAEKDYAQQVRDRLAKGEDAQKLQTEAFQHVGSKLPEPPVELASRHRSSLPASQGAVFQLQPGEVSQPFAESNAYFIYKMVSHTAPTFDAQKETVRKAVLTERFRDLNEKLNSQFKVTVNENYFGATGPEPGGPPTGSERPTTSPRPNTPTPAAGGTQTPPKG